MSEAQTNAEWIGYLADGSHVIVPSDVPRLLEIESVLRSHDELRASLQDWLYLAAGIFPEFCEDDAPDCDPEETLCCNQCKEVGCIQRKIRNARAALAKAERNTRKEFS